MKTTLARQFPSSPAVAAARKAVAEWCDATDQPPAMLQHALGVADILEGLEAESETIAGTLLHPLLSAGVVGHETAAQRLGEPAALFARELEALGNFRISGQWSEDDRLSAGQAESLRKMLLAVITDPRLVLARLAEQLFDLRHAETLPPERRRQLARETREVYAPLANRLGIWQLKWELEDLTFRLLEPAEYRRIAAHLNERRADRERYIEDLRAEIARALAEAGVEAEVTGRPKHIYSIWRKMQRKRLGFEQVFDVRAVRVLTRTVADCYAALGVVHGGWPYIPGEFDDYIATPKDNDYRSLHTAVIGPGGLPVEVQIRTFDMHEHAELGVAAHWRYKEGVRDTGYDRKVQWLRELLAPSAGTETEPDFLDRVRAELFEDRVYVLSPKGDVVDLPAGATPIDFAYHVHTSLGHRCRGARVNSRLVPLDHKLSNGEVVEIIAAKQPQPSRDWLMEQLGYLASPRSRSKVRAWFRQQDEGRNRQEGRELLERELGRLGLAHAVPLPELLAEMNIATADALYLGLGTGDVNIAQVSGAIQRRLRARAAEAPPPPAPAKPRRKAATGLTVEGVGDLACTYARCCSPVPPQPIAGYVTVGRGVTVHRADCPSLERMRARQPERVLAVDWGSAADRAFAVDIQVQAFDRRGLLRDISGLLADEKISIERVNSVSDASRNIADITLTASIRSLEELSRVLTRLKSLPNVIAARRRV
ncbi:MAG: bifunctional (p)ppGpp synthetase/guanosine-3',5'-bis(diphosphate) 3'-pyrophosphohydrolase [Steroidobacteraceae bacterium]|jgi:GTP pyrophosphokinase|nr:bifunctional (p)ppGpp synthetase/guanosine-3',5'-bis(diphosphate) 3'-pyrophosphohydrolase [Steroidobacteraceae bacterium]